MCGPASHAAGYAHRDGLCPYAALESGVRYEPRTNPGNHFPGTQKKNEGQTGTGSAVRDGEVPMMCGCDDKLLQAVYETGFALDEATLYLDTHPDCPMAMQYFQNARRMNRQAMKSYEEVNGPLQVADADFNNWNWINGPWPWEGGMR